MDDMEVDCDGGLYQEVEDHQIKLLQCEKSLIQTNISCMNKAITELNEEIKLSKIDIITSQETIELMRDMNVDQNNRLIEIDSMLNRFMF